MFVLKLYSPKAGNLIFNFKLPASGLALRSVRIVDGVPEFCFDASRNVPTISDENVATAFRLASENKRPSFCYGTFSPTNPMHNSRFFKHHSPLWVRHTEIGELLAEADWIMKCVCLGTKTNQEKTVFKSSSRSSQLKHLSTILDLPREKGESSIIMSCDHATVQMTDNEIIFPEDPKMKITDAKSPLYSQYITDMYDSVAYHDEPKLLKMQELIKLILAVEWLYKEKGIRMNKEWIRYHTSKSKKDASYLDLSERKEPPSKMIPRPPAFQAPSSDVAVYDFALGVYKTCIKNDMGERRWGHYDFESKSMIAFKGDGTPCPPQKVLPGKKVRYYSLMAAEFREMPTTLHQGIALTWPEIPGMCDEADVKSREKLIADWTVPIPCVFAQGEWEPSGMGGVSTFDIAVEEKPICTMPAHKETQWKGNYKNRGTDLVVRAEELGTSLSTT